MYSVSQNVEDLYDITCIQKQAFIMHMKERSLIFNRREKLYMADWSDVGTVAATVQEGE